MIASAVLLDRNITLRTLFRIRRNPIGRLRVIITFLNPLAKQSTLHRIVPLLAALETKHMTTFTFNRSRLDILNFNGIATIGRRTPAKKTVAFDKTVCDQMLIFRASSRFRQKTHHRRIVNQNI
jgi:hypothetical protein